MNKRILVGGLLLGWGLSLVAVPIQGTVSERGVVAVEIPPILRTQTNERSDSAFENEFRVRDSKGEDVPYVIRPRQLVRVSHETRWQSLRVVAVQETNGQLTVETEWPHISGKRSALETVRIDTPLTDFEQNVTVSAGGKELVRARLCDYSRFAQFRQTEFQLPGASANRLTFTFSHPTSEQETATFERMITSRGDGTVDAQMVRRQVTERPFRVARISVSYSAEVTRRELAPPNWVSVVSERKEDAENHCTCFYFNAGYLPLVGLHTDFARGNYDRKVALEVYQNQAWHQVSEGRIRSIDLGNRQENRQDQHWYHPRPCGTCRLVVQNGDSPLLKGDPENLIQVACPSEELVFIAEPGERYEGVCVAGAKRPVYDEAVQSVLQQTLSQAPADTLRFDLPSSRLLRFDTPKEQPSLDLPIEREPVPEPPNWFLENGVKLASILVFFILVAVCLQLFRSTSSPAK